MQNVELENAKVYFLQPDNQFATKRFLASACPISSLFRR